MVIYPQGPALRADYYDSEGHVIRYAVQADSGGAVFLSDAVAGLPRFRLTYALVADSTLTGRFEIASPDKPEEFQPYLAWSARRTARP
jgi:hypothetical protein